MTQTLFDKGKAEQPSPGEVAAARAMEGNPRLRVPQRNQVEIHWASLDELLEPEHPARMVWACVCGLDLHCWLKTIKAVEGVAGRDATDPRLLVGVWVFAAIAGAGRDAGGSQRGGGVVSAWAAFGAVSGGGPRASRGPEDVVGRVARGYNATAAGGAKASVGRAATTFGGGPSPLRRVATAARRNGENHREKADRSAVLDHRSGIAHDEVCGRRVSARLQCSIQHRHGQRHYRGRGRNQPRHRQRRVAADVGTTGGALRSPAGRSVGGRGLCLLGCD